MGFQAVSIVVLTYASHGTSPISLDRAFQLLQIYTGVLVSKVVAHVLM